MKYYEVTFKVISSPTQLNNAKEYEQKKEENETASTVLLRPSVHTQSLAYNIMCSLHALEPRRFDDFAYFYPTTTNALARESVKLIQSISE